MPERSKKLTPTFRRAAAVWALIVGAYFLWEALAYRGIFARLAELQIGRFGAYAPLVTYMLLFALAVVPVLIILWLISGREPGADDRGALIVTRLGQAQRLRSVLRALGVIALLVAGGFALYASAFLPGQTGRMQTVAVSEIGAIDIAEGPARLVGGELGTIVYFGHDWYISDQRMAFAPYRPAGGDGVSRLFVELDARDRGALEALQQRPEWSGILVKGGLPGPARVLFSSIGVGIGEPYYTLYRTDHALKIGYWLQAVQWLIVAVFLGAVVLVQSRRIRRLERERDTLAD